MSLAPSTVADSHTDATPNILCLGSQVTYVQFAKQILGLACIKRVPEL